jgi:hypothetical protein
MKLRVLLLAALLGVAPNVVLAKKELPMPLAVELPVAVTFDQRQILGDHLEPQYRAYNPTMGLAGNLAADLIIAGIVARQISLANTRTPVLVEMLGDYPFEQVMTDKLKASLSAEGITTKPLWQIRNVAADPAAPGAKPAEWQLPETGPLLYLHPHYAMEYTAQKVVVSIDAAFVERFKKPDGKQGEKTIKSQRYGFELLLDRTFGRDGAGNLERWRGVGGEQLRHELDLAVGQAVDMLVYDLSPAGRAEGEHGPKHTEFVEYDDIRIRARELRDADGIMWVRTHDGFGITGGMSAEPDGPKHVKAAVAASAAAPAATPAPASTPDAELAPAVEPAGGH